MIVPASFLLGLVLQSFRYGGWAQLLSFLKFPAIFGRLSFAFLCEECVFAASLLTALVWMENMEHPFLWEV